MLAGVSASQSCRSGIVCGLRGSTDCAGRRINPDRAARWIGIDQRLLHLNRRDFMPGRFVHGQGDVRHPVRPPGWADPDQPHDVGRRSHLPASRLCRVGVTAEWQHNVPSRPRRGPATLGAAQRSCRIATEKPDPPTLGRPVSQGVSLMPASVTKRPSGPDTPGAAGGQTNKTTEHTRRLQCGTGRLDAG